MRELLLVGAGGFCGAVLRYWTGSWVHRHFSDSLIPLGTLIVNGTGCLLLALLAAFAEARGTLAPDLRLLLMVGFLGSFTTYSTFNQESYVLALDRAWPLAMANVALHLMLGLAAAAAGHGLGHWLGRG